MLQTDKLTFFQGISFELARFIISQENVRNKGPIVCYVSVGAVVL